MLLLPFGSFSTGGGPHLANARNTNQNTLVRLCRAREVVAALVIEDPVYLPIFERLEREVAIEEARVSSEDALTRARAIAAAQTNPLITG